jgi:hypothetical protein
MRVVVLFAVLTAGLSMHSCGSKDDSAGDFYQSCNYSIIENSVDLSLCLESKNSTSLKETCESGQTPGIYAQTQCVVSAGSKGCAFKNQNGVDVTYWYTGTSWTSSQITTDCSGRTGGQVVTKQ